MKSNSNSVQIGGSDIIARQYAAVKTNTYLTHVDFRDALLSFRVIFISSNRCRNGWQSLYLMSASHALKWSFTTFSSFGCVSIDPQLRDSEQLSSYSTSSV